MVQATKHALGEISVAMMREADAELIDTLAAAAAAAPRNSFQATLLANRLSNAKFVLVGYGSILPTVMKAFIVIRLFQGSHDDQSLTVYVTVYASVVKRRIHECDWTSGE